MPRRAPGEGVGPGFARLKALLPNGLTLLGLCAGVMAIHFASAREWSQALLSMTYAAVFDMLDGRVARLLGVESEFGAQLDSLADLVSFGIAPAVIVGAWALVRAPGQWVCTLVFSGCCALRLARFNCERGRGASTAPASFFTGLPAPGAAGLILLPLLLRFQSGWPGFQAPLLNIAIVLLVSVLMVARIPTLSLKRLPILAGGKPVLGVIAALGVVLGLRWPWTTASVGWLCYGLTIPVGILIALARSGRPTGKGGYPGASRSDSGAEGPAAEVGMARN